MNLISLRSLLVLCVLGGVCATLAWPRKSFSDAEIVGRSEAVVVARLKADSISFVPHGAAEHLPALDDVAVPRSSHRVELVVEETLKGSMSVTSLLVSVSGGLIPVVGGYYSNQFGHVVRFLDTNYPDGMVEMFDSGNSVKGPHQRFTGDLRTNHIWLLRRFPSVSAHPDKTGDSMMLGIADPEDIQPVDRREALIEHLQ